MSEGPVRHCPGCGQALRFPSHIGGMLMACPACGHRFASPFRLAGAPSVPPPSTASPRPAPASETAPASTAPTAAGTLPEAAPRPVAPAGDKPARPTTLAAKVAAKYAAKS